MVRREKFNATILSLTLVVSTIAAVTVLGAAVGTVGAIHPSDAPDLSDSANFTVNLPHTMDHYPGDQNAENGSIEYFASGADAFAEQDAEEGVYVDWIIIHAEYDGEAWIDYSACSTQNTKAFGIDRGGDNEGTEFDEDLVTHRKGGEFLDEGLTVEFYNWEDVPEDPPYIAPEDHIVAAQGAGSPGGSCLTMTEKPGWYRIAGFMNGTVADNGPDQRPSDSAEEIRFQLDSTYVYVCECDSEQEARDELGPPPNEDGGDDGATDDGESTPTATAESGSTDDDSNTDDGSGDDGSGDDGSDDGSSTDDSSTDDGGDDGADDSSTDDGADDSSDDTGGDDTGGDDGNGGTPAADGPGFGALAALVALLASALALYRRD